MAAMSGLAASSRRASIACVRPDRSSDCSRVLSVLNTLISAPATNVWPAPMRTTASTFESADARATASSTASHTPGPSAFTGGLSIVRTATRCLVSYRTGLDITALARRSLWRRRLRKRARVDYHAPHELRVLRQSEGPRAATRRVHERTRLPKRAGLSPTDCRGRPLAADADRRGVEGQGAGGRPVEPVSPGERVRRRPEQHGICPARRDHGPLSRVCAGSL